MTMTTARPARRAATLLPAIILLFAAPLLQAAPPPIELLAARPAVIDASLSPDGRSVAVVRSQGGSAALVLYDRQARKNQVLLGEPKDNAFRRCHWVSARRIVCAFDAYAQNNAGYAYRRSRLVAVDTDGQDMKTLAQSSAAVRGENLADVVAWHTREPETILIQADEGIGQVEEDTGVINFGAQGSYGVPAVFEINTRSNRVRMRMKGRSSVLDWTADASGEVRLGWGLSGTKMTSYARLGGDADWRALVRSEAFVKSEGFTPVALSRSAPDKAYAMAYTNDRQAVWLVDLADKADPELLYSHDLVDVKKPLFDQRGDLVGFRYDTDLPHMYYVDPDYAGVAAIAEAALPGQFIQVFDRDDAAQVYLLSAESDRSARSFYVYDRGTKKFSLLGVPYPGLDPGSLAPMKAIAFAARDGTVIPGFLTMPAGSTTGKVPLVVMPHGGPEYRDTWEFDFLRHFLSTRGYAVLQVNFRGSDGYGWDWLMAAHQDWGGLSYDDVVDGVRWAIQQGIADPARVGIVGWSYGGYIAESGALNDPELFKCAASIAGVSDLSKLVDRWYLSVAYKYERARIGIDSDKLARSSPLQHAEDFKVPILLVHGDDDTRVPYEQSKLLDRALTRASKPHRFVTIKGGDHSLLHAESDRVTLLHELDDFMGKYCPAGG